MSETSDEKRMKLRYAGTCRLCGTALEARAEAIYERTTKTIRCTDCSPTLAERAVSGGSEADATALLTVEEADVTARVGPIDVGTPGASARREFDRRHAKREAETRDKHPKLGGFLLAINDDPQSTTAWDVGALGEERLGHRLNDLASDTLRVLHDRRIPGSRANIDHIAVASTGIYVIDAKRYVDKRPTLRVEGGLLRPRLERLMVGGRDQTKLVDGVLKQVGIVRAVVGDEVPVTGVLCFIEGNGPLIGGAFTVRDVDVLRPKQLYRRLGRDGPHASRVVELHRALAAALPPA